MNRHQIITRRADGEYSTVTQADGTIETCWFPKVGPSRVIGRTPTPALATVAARHIAEHEATA